MCMACFRLCIVLSLNIIAHDHLTGNYLVIVPAIIHPTGMFLSSDLLFEYWVESIIMKHPCINLTFPTRIVCIDGWGSVTGCPFGVCGHAEYYIYIEHNNYTMAENSRVLTPLMVSSEYCQRINTMRADAFVARSWAGMVLVVSDWCPDCEYKLINFCHHSKYKYIYLIHLMFYRVINCHYGVYLWYTS